MTRTHVLVNNVATGQNLSQIFCQGCLAGAGCTSTKRKKKVVNVCTPEDYGEYAPYSDDDYSLPDHCSVRILSQGVGNRERGKKPRWTLTDTSSESAGVNLVRNHHSNGKRKQTQPRTFVSLDPFLPHIFRSST